VAATALLLGLTACKVPPRQEVTLHDHVPVVQQDAGNQAAPWPSEHWWTRYDDAVLSQLIQTATVGAPRIELATARIDTAREQVRLAGASQGLNVDVKGSWQRLRLSDNGLLPPEFLGFNWYNQSDLGLEVRYTLDWWGKQRAGIDAALDRARAALVEQRATMLALSAAVAQEYFGWQADSARLALAEQVVAQVQLDADRIEPFLLGGADATTLPGLLPELFLLVRKPVDPIEDGFVRHVHAPFATCSSCEIGPSRYHVSSSPLPLTSTVPWCSKAKSSVSSS